MGGELRVRRHDEVMGSKFNQMHLYLYKNVKTKLIILYIINLKN